MSSKACTKCREVKEYSEYYSRGPTRLVSRCKKCILLYQKVARSEPTVKERIKKYGKSYRVRENSIYLKIKGRAKRFGISFNLKKKT